MANHAQNPSIHNPELPDRASARSLNPLICDNAGDTIGAAEAMLRNLIHVAGTDDEAVMANYFYELNCIAAALDYENRQAGYELMLQAQSRNNANS